MNYSGDNYPGHPHHEAPMAKRTYTNRKPETMELIETCRPGKKPDQPLHAFPIKPGESITLATRPGIRRRWRKN